jgi:endoglucanase
MKTKSTNNFLIFTVLILLPIAGLKQGSESSRKYRPEIIQIGMAAPDVIVLNIQAQWVEHGKQIPYVKQAGDVVQPQGQHRFIRRDGKFIGCLVGKEDNILTTTDKIVGDTLDIKTIVETESYAISSQGKKIPVAVMKVFRKSKPVDCLRSPAPEGFPIEHKIILKLTGPLEIGKVYTISFNEGLLSKNKITFTYNPAQLQSEAIHVNQVGFRPDDPSKLAFLSFWMGDGGNLEYPFENTFNLVDEKTGKVVFSGRTKLAKAASAEGNRTSADIHQLDFSAYNKSGIFRISIEGIGCSFPFEISELAWTNAFIKSMRGLYCQHSGIELKPPITSFIRPRGFRPEDGVKVYVSEPKKDSEDPSLRILNPALQAVVSSYIPSKGIFKRLIDDLTNQVLPNAWGGYMDAGDWDRRPDHALMPLMMFDLAEMSPQKYARLSFNTTDSEDNLPDLINEALWEVNFLKRMQQPDGSIFGGIESGEHPRRGECSWQESLPVIAYSRTKNVAYNYVADGARAAHWFQSNKLPQLAQEYIQSILKAFEWAEKSKTIDSLGGGSKDARCLAAAELFRLTGEQKYHDMFLDATRFKDPNSPFYTSSKGPETDQQGEAGWTYLMTEYPGVNKEIRQNILDALVRDADMDVRGCEETDFHWRGGEKQNLWWGALSMPGSHVLCRAHFITGKNEYLKAIINSTLTGTGANPVNMCYVTGVGSRYPLHPLHEDSYTTNQELYEGVTVGGPIDPTVSRHPNSVKVMKRIYPEAKSWPAAESFYDVFMYVPMNEFTVHQTMLPTSFVWGYLAARK